MRTEWNKDIQEDMRLLLKEIWHESLDQNKEEYYESYTNLHLLENVDEARLFINSEFEERSIKNFRLDSYDERMVWPWHTFYCYGMDAITNPELLEKLHFGYAVMEDRSVIKTAFYDMMSILPHGGVVDPLSVKLTVRPKYYMGVNVDMESLQTFFRSRERIPGTNLEEYVKRVNKKAHEARIKESEEEAYQTQLTYAPKYFPSSMIAWAKENDKYIPPGQECPW